MQMEHEHPAYRYRIKPAPRIRLRPGPHKNPALTNVAGMAGSTCFGRSC
jgi:hypothetical protein